MRSALIRQTTRLVLLLAPAAWLATPGAGAASIPELLPLYPHLWGRPLALSATRWALATPDASAKVVHFYLSVPGQAGWRRLSPSPSALVAWQAANRKAPHHQQSIVIILTNPKDKLNCELEIGSVQRASRPRQLTIISIRVSKYSQQRASVR